MRDATLAMTVALGLVAGQLQAAPPKSPPADVGPGRIAWFDITTSNLPQAKEFYGRLFEWKFAPVQGSDQAVEIVARGEAIGTLRVAEGKIGPFNLPDGTGAVALVLDPTGHPVGMYSRTPLPSAVPPRSDGSAPIRGAVFGGPEG